ncbi:hypothetical protein [Achromobacter aegrifaciens]|uniref:hypothetical protein n=1 Tax=Achromobacter aegrifaciens TaxID=1287736 RepID=UPI000F748BDA|nr:hypothetical protein [Achromobacter aegrifaciens]RSE90774.1 hypothetical protein EGU54_32280 [Achromobacter aegrifaciens]
MTTKHTPGPWEIDGEYVQQVGQTGLAICDVMNMDVGGDKGWYSGPITQANKHLIAAAPELLDACMAMLEWDDREQDHAVDFYARMDLCRTAFDKARAAIAKAKGEQQ